MADPIDDWLRQLTFTAPPERVTLTQWQALYTSNPARPRLTSRAFAMALLRKGFTKSRARDGTVTYDLPPGTIWPLAGEPARRVHPAIFIVAVVLLSMTVFILTAPKG